MSFKNKSLTLIKIRDREMPPDVFSCTLIWFWGSWARSPPAGLPAQTGSDTNATSRGCHAPGGPPLGPRGRSLPSRWTERGWPKGDWGLAFWYPARTPQSPRVQMLVWVEPAVDFFWGENRTITNGTMQCGWQVAAPGVQWRACQCGHTQLGKNGLFWRSSLI